jgi:hypothetical protein
LHWAPHAGSLSTKSTETWSATKCATTRSRSATKARTTSTRSPGARSTTAGEAAAFQPARRLTAELSGIAQLPATLHQLAKTFLAGFIITALRTRLKSFTFKRRLKIRIGCGRVPPFQSRRRRHLRPIVLSPDHRRWDEDCCSEQRHHEQEMRARRPRSSACA